MKKRRLSIINPISQFRTSVSRLSTRLWRNGEISNSTLDYIENAFIFKKIAFSKNPKNKGADEEKFQIQVKIRYVTLSGGGFRVASSNLYQCVYNNYVHEISDDICIESEFDKNKIIEIDIEIFRSQWIHTSSQPIETFRTQLSGKEVFDEHRIPVSIDGKIGSIYFDLVYTSVEKRGFFFRRLPEDVVVRFVSYLPLKDLRNFMMVNKRYHILLLKSEYVWMNHKDSEVIIRNFLNQQERIISIQKLMTITPIPIFLTSTKSQLVRIKVKELLCRYVKLKDTSGTRTIPIIFSNNENETRLVTITSNNSQREEEEEEEVYSSEDWERRIIQNLDIERFKLYKKVKMSLSDYRSHCPSKIFEWLGRAIEKDTDFPGNILPIILLFHSSILKDKTIEPMITSWLQNSYFEPRRIEKKKKKNEDDDDEEEDVFKFSSPKIPQNSRYLKPKNLMSDDDDEEEEEEGEGEGEGEDIDMDKSRRKDEFKKYNLYIYPILRYLLKNKDRFSDPRLLENLVMEKMISFATFSVNNDENTKNRRNSERSSNLQQEQQKLHDERRHILLEHFEECFNITSKIEGDLRKNNLLDRILNKMKGEVKESEIKDREKRLSVLLDL